MAVRTAYRPVPEPRLRGALARASAYVLLVVTCTAVAALGGYQVGLRTDTTATTSAAQRAAAQRAAVRRAVATQVATDRRLRRRALAQAMSWQRAKFEEELSARISEVRTAEAANAARAYRRGRAAGRSALIAEVQARRPDEKPPAQDPSAVQEAPPAR